MPPAETIIDLGGASHGAHEGALLSMGYPYTPKRITIVDLHPDERIYTFWVNDAAFRRNAGFRMDFLLLTPNLAARLVDTGVDSAERGKDKASDHAPVWVRLREPSRP